MEDGTIEYEEVFEEDISQECEVAAVQEEVIDPDTGGSIFKLLVERHNLSNNKIFLSL